MFTSDTNVLSEDTATMEMDTTQPEQVWHLSVHAVAGTEAPSCLQIHGWLQGQEVLMLVDSGISASFVSQHMPRTIKVSVSNGAELQCTQEVLNCQWYTQGQTFSTNFKVLPLGSYDVILGMDWLEYHSPMLIDWPRRCMQIENCGYTILLQGVAAKNQSCALLSCTQLGSINKNAAVAYVVQLCYSEGAESEVTVQAQELSPDIVQLLLEFEDIFLEPTELPPSRDCNHKIPLMQGSQPVNMRQYRHKPELKTEIERQVLELLKVGIIQKSTSPFSSPIILVKKKDGTWRLCIDYRRLNAMTIVSRYPVPIIEGILDELAGAHWFSKLDLRAGYQ